MLQLLNAVLANPEQAAAFTGPPSVQLCNGSLLKALVWRAGKAAAAVRFTAVTALSTLFAQRLLSREQVKELLDQEQLLRMLFQSLEEEYFVDTRLMACSVACHILLSAGDSLTSEQGRLMYVELLKRLDDSSNLVRASVCQALTAFAQQSQSCLDDSNLTYLINGMLVHMDDTDQSIQEAVCLTLTTLAALRPKLVKHLATQVQHLHRSKLYSTRVLTACKS